MTNNWAKKGIKLGSRLWVSGLGTNNWANKGINELGSRLRISGLETSARKASWLGDT